MESSERIHYSKEVSLYFNVKGESADSFTPNCIGFHETPIEVRIDSGKMNLVIIVYDRIYYFVSERSTVMKLCNFQLFIVLTL